MSYALTAGDLAVRETFTVRHEIPLFLLFVQNGVEYGHGVFERPEILSSSVKTLYVVVFDRLNAE